MPSPSFAGRSGRALALVLLTAAPLAGQTAAAAVPDALLAYPNLVLYRHVSPAGAVVKLELADPDGGSRQAEVTREQHEVLRARVGESLYVKPRRLRIFVEPEPASSGAPGASRPSRA